MVRIHDFNGDGLKDIIVGDYNAEFAGYQAGRIQILSALDGSLLFQKDGAEGDLFGYAITQLGDQNGDGIPEFAVGAPYARDDAGTIGIYSGADASLLLELVGYRKATPQFGERVWDCGDYSGDGISDLVLRTDHSTAQIYDLQNQQVLFDLYNASSVKGLDDMDGDGYRELLLETIKITSVYSTVNRDILWEVHDNWQTRTSIGCPDFTGDGFQDLLHFARGNLHYLDALTGTTIKIVSLASGDDNPRLIADINGDQIEDVICTWRDKIEAYSGANGHHIWQEDRLGNCISTWGDEDQDGNPEILCNGDGTSIYVTEILPGLQASRQTLSASSSDVVDLAIDFAIARAFKPYAVLASDVEGSTWINQFEIPLGMSQLLAQSMSRGALPGSTGFQGQLDANGDAFAKLTPAPRLGRFVGQNLSLCTVVFDYLGAIPVGERCSQVVQIRILP